VLAVRARGDLWLWSDADVTAPAGFLNALVGQLLDSGSQAVTAPYCIRDLHQGCEVLDALFVNVEFLPGTLLLGQLNRRSHAYGAAILFRAETFRARANWTELGAALADDNALGRQLQPVQLARTLAATFTQPSGWLAAWRHYYRWQKTVRWCQPGGFAALLVLMPVFGWSAAGAFSLSHVAQLVGLGTLWGGEILVTLAACGLVRCRLTLAAVPGIVLWPLLRPVTWLLVWLPLPVVWSGRKPKWSAPQQA
jgi:ceramide glucosyltransferase